jgi:hypothetical protein
MRRLTPSPDSGLVADNPLTGVFIQDLVKPSIWLDEDDLAPALRPSRREAIRHQLRIPTQAPHPGQLAKPGNLDQR